MCGSDVHERRGDEGDSTFWKAMKFGSAPEPWFKAHMDYMDYGPISFISLVSKSCNVHLISHSSHKCQMHAKVFLCIFHSPWARNDQFGPLPWQIKQLGHSICFVRFGVFLLDSKCMCTAVPHDMVIQKKHPLSASLSSNSSTSSWHLWLQHEATA